MPLSALHGPGERLRRSRNSYDKIWEQLDGAHKYTMRRVCVRDGVIVRLSYCVGGSVCGTRISNLCRQYRTVYSLGGDRGLTHAPDKEDALPNKNPSTLFRFSSHAPRRLPLFSVALYARRNMPFVSAETHPPLNWQLNALFVGRS